MDNKFSLDCTYYTETFNTVSELLDHVISTGMDPDYEITKNGRGIGNTVMDYLG